jgi:hypothetical protein
MLIAPSAIVQMGAQAQLPGLSNRHSDPARIAPGHRLWEGSGRAALIYPEGPWRPP